MNEAESIVIHPQAEPARAYETARQAVYQAWLADQPDRDDALYEAWCLLHQSHSEPFGGMALNRARQAFLGRADTKRAHLQQTLIEAQRAPDSFPIYAVTPSTDE